MHGRAGFANEDIDEGRWWIEDDLWCRRWRQWSYGDIARFRTVVEDNQITQKVIIGFLDGGGHDISTANSAEEALEKINKDAFDLVFMDIEMGF